MYTRVSAEVVELNQKIADLARKIEDLSAINTAERNKRELAEKELIKLKSQILRLEMEKSNR